MRTFSKAFFGGYQRDEVDDYIDSITRELDRLKSSVQEELEKEKQHSAAMQKELQRSEAERAELSAQLAALNADVSRLAELEQQASKYKEEYRQLQDVLTEARLEAKSMTSAAQLDAQAIRRKGQKDADAVLEKAKKQGSEHLKQVQAEIDQIQAAAEAHSKQTRIGIQQQVETIETVQNCLSLIHRDLKLMHQKLGDNLKEMPEAKDAAGQKLTVINTLTEDHSKQYGA